MKPARIVVIEDSPTTAQSLRRALELEGYEVLVESRGDAGLALCLEHECHAVITDLRMPGMSGIEVVRTLREKRPGLPVVLMTAFGTAETAIEATRLGAYDYILKPFELEPFLMLVRQAVARGESAAAAESANSPEALGEIIGNSVAMQAVYKEIGHLSDSSMTVLVSGETGTGKELVARAIHRHSKRASEPFVAVNCAAIPETLLESELFGHERGAFTGAHCRRVGRFEQAGEGTLFLDEIGEVSPGTQAKLLRVLQEKTFCRLGGNEGLTTSARIVAATNRDLLRASEERQFREDLYYRLCAATIRVPPLRERREDIPHLAVNLLRRYADEAGGGAPSLGPDALDYLKSQPWPGNVRQLENVLRKAALQSRGYAIRAEDVARCLYGEPAAQGNGNATGGTVSGIVARAVERAKRGEATNIHHELVSQVEEELLRQAWRESDGNQARMAQWLGVSRPTLRDKLKGFGIGGDKRQEGTT